MALDDLGGIVPRADADAVLDRSASGVASTAARALVLGAALTGGAALEGLAEDLVEIGVEGLPPYWGGPTERAAVLERSDRVLAEHDLLERVVNAERLSGYPFATDRDAALRPARFDLWERTQLDRSSESAVAFLRSLMTDVEPVASAAAACALSAWRAPADSDVPAPLARARDLRYLYARGTTIGGATEIARASLSSGAGGAEDTAPLRFRQDPGGGSPGSCSVMVHGTAAYAGDWWYPGGDFHTYVLQHLRSDLYAGGAPFTWSGAYKRGHRKVAAKRLAEWARQASRSKLHTVFAHSYGGVIALLATTYGLQVDELVLLSVPVEKVPVEWRNVGRAASLRIHLDLVLLAARRRQMFTENVEENYLPYWFWRHDYSHSTEVWEALGCARSLLP